MRCVGKIVVPMLFVLFICGCDRKVSQATVALMDQTTKVAIALDTQWAGQAENITSVKPEEEADNAATMNSVAALLKSLAKTCSNFNDAVQAKAVLAKASADGLTQTVATVKCTRALVVQWQAKVKAKDPANNDVITIWKEQTLLKFDALIVLLNQLDASVQSDLQLNEKK
jgi:hypothetical protein